MEIVSVPVRKDYQADIANTNQLCALLMKSPHYAKMGQEGIFAIVQTAKSLGIDPTQALGGGLYYVKGKVELSARMMNTLIRSQKHSISRDKRSDDTICILHGKRADNGDTWTESFSIEEAQKAGLMGNSVWKTYPRDMLFARALSRLARQLFPDIIGNCYVEGEISLDPSIPSTPALTIPQEEEIIEEFTAQAPPTTLCSANVASLFLLTQQLDEQTRQGFFEWIKKAFNASCLEEIPRDQYEKCLHSLTVKIKYLNDKNKTQEEVA